MLPRCWRAALAVTLISAWLVPAQADIPDDSRQQAVDALFAEFRCPGSPGAAIGIHHGGRQVYARGYGCADLENDIPVTATTRFHVASVSKQFTAFSVALLAREGKVDLDADIRTHLPFIPDLGKRITPRDLIHHTSGLRDQWLLFELGGKAMDDRLRQQQVVNMVSRQRALNFDPGTEYMYSNTGYTMLAELVRSASGKSLREFAAERIFAPLGMNRSFFFDDVTEIVPGRAQSYAPRGSDGQWQRSLLNYDTAGATSLFTTAEDLLKWAGNFSHPKAGDAALIQQVATPGTLRDGRPINYAFGLIRKTFAGRPALVHYGADAGFRSLFAYFPAEDFAVAMLNNAPPEDWNGPVEAIVDLYLNGGARTRPPELEKVVPAPDRLRALAGSYLSEFEPKVELQLKDGRLWWTSVGETTPVVFRADGSFDLGDTMRTWFRLQAERDARGRIVGIENLTYREYAVPSRFKRIELRAVAPEALAELLGDYRSPELDITYTFTLEDGHLTARTLWLPEPIVFTPTIPDRFDSAHYSMSTIVVDRDSARNVTGLRVHAEGMRNVILERVVAKSAR